LAFKTALLLDHKELKKDLDKLCLDACKIQVRRLILAEFLPSFLSKNNKFGKKKFSKLQIFDKFNFFIRKPVSCFINSLLKVGHPWVGLGFLPEPNPCGFFPLQTQLNPTQLTKPRKPR
jgi:hypothetical protein